MTDKMLDSLYETIIERWNPGQSFSASELVALTEQSDRTIRRKLQSLVTSGHLIRTGKNKGVKYHRPSQQALQEEPQSVWPHPFFSSASISSLSVLDTPFHMRKPVSYEIARLEEYQPNQTFYVSKELRLRLGAMGKRGSLDNQANTYIQKIFDRLLVDFSYNSSRLEGNTYTINETTQLIENGEEAEGKHTAESLMILNHKEAVRNASQIAALSETPSFEDICSIHYLLSDGLIKPDHSGEIRDEAVGITGTTYSPLEDQERLTRYLELIATKAGEVNDPIERALFLLVNIAYLQPFIDVNKRTSRICSIIPLLAAKLVPLTFLNVSATDYANAMLAFYELGDVTPAVEMFAWSYERSCAYYDVQTVAVGFNEVNASHRTIRREFIRWMITTLTTGSELLEALNEFANEQISKGERQQFIKDTNDDIKRLTIVRIRGLGVTRGEFEDWQKANAQSQARN